MPQNIPTFQSLPCHRLTTALGDAQYQLRFTWYDRLGAWYLDLFDVDGNQIVGGRRLSPGVSPLGNMLPAGKPDGGVLLVTGNDPYLREYLGDEVLLQWYSDAEIEAQAPDDTSLIRVSS